MKIEFSRTGGFAAPALRQHLEIDTDDLPAQEAHDLIALVKKADINDLKLATNSYRAPDAFRYRITVTEGDVTETATASDADMPAALTPLIDWLSERASDIS